MDFEKAIALFEGSGNTCMIFDGEKAVRTFQDHGIKPLVFTLMEEPALLEDATVTDAVIGRAAALLCVEGRAKQVYGRLMSKGAQKVLEDAGIHHRAATVVEQIENRDRTDTCPMEKKVAHTADSHEAYVIFSTFLKAKMEEEAAGK